MANALFNDYWRVAWLQHEAHDLFLGHASYHSFITLSFLVSPGGASAGRASHSTVEGQRCGFMEVNVISSGHCRAAAFNIGMVFIADVGFPFDTMTVSPVGLRIRVH